MAVIFVEPFHLFQRLLVILFIALKRRRHIVKILRQSKDFKRN